MQHIPIAGDAEDIQPEWPQLGAYATHMPDEGATRVAAGGTHAEAWLQEVKGKMAFTLLEQAHQERVLAGRAAHNRAIDDEQVVGITVLYHVPGKVRPLHEPERFFVVFTRGLQALYHLSSSCHHRNAPGSVRCVSLFARLITVYQKSIARR